MAKKIAVALTEDAEKTLKPLIDRMWTIPWTESIEKPTCLVCDHVDFSGLMVELHVLPAKKQERTTSAPLWIPHSFIVMAFDFSRAKTVGFR